MLTMSMNQVVRAMSTMSRRPPALLRGLDDHHHRQPISPAPRTPGSSSSSCGGGGTAITSVYQIYIKGIWRNVVITWSSKNLMNVCLTVRVEAESSSSSYSSLSSGCKVELKPWHFWSSKKGSKSFDIAEDDDNNRCVIEVYWDLRYAKFQGASPEPSSEYYVCISCEDEILLIVGDRKRKAYKRTKKRAAKVEPVQTMRREVSYGKKSFTARARFAESGGGGGSRHGSRVLPEDEGGVEVAENEVLVESTVLGKDDNQHNNNQHNDNQQQQQQQPPELWISVDGTTVVHVTNLQWKFRGNETVTVNKQPLQVFWDVHAWLFPGAGGERDGGGGVGCGVFTFKPVGPSEDVPEMEESDGDGGLTNDNSTEDQRGADFCLTLHAWKLD